ncbi:MAG: response regulator [Bacteroidales bacterium]
MDDKAVSSKFNQTVADISSGFINSTKYNVDVKINSMLSSIIEIFNLDRAYLFGFEDNNSYMNNTHESCAIGASSVIDLQKHLSLEKFKWWKHQILSNNFIHIADINSLPKEASAEKDFFKLTQVRSLVAVPIKANGTVIGFIGMESISSKKKWDNNNINLLKILANTIAETYQNIAAQEQIEKLSQMQSVLLNIAKIYINTPLNLLETAIKDSLKEIAQLVGADRSYIFDYDFKENTTTNTYEWCAVGISSQIKNLQNVPTDMLYEWLAMHKAGKAFIVADISKLPNDGPISVRGLLEPQGVKSIISVPMIDENSLIGFVGFDSVRKHHVYSDKEKYLLSFFAQMIVSVKKKSYYELAINHAKEKAEEANRAKTEFLANISHEIRTPLNSVIGFTELLSGTPLNISQKKFVENANISAQSLMEIINDVLDFSKIEAGKLELSPVKTDIIDFSEQICDLIKHQAINKELELLLNVQPDLPPFAVIDPLRLKQVLLNLLSNAIKFTEKGEVELKISYKKTAENRGMFSFYVRDTGIGISKEDQSKLFKAFVQADSTTTRKFGGTGLGLVISSHLVNKMGGIIELESTLGRGSQFYFSIETESDESIIEFNSNKLNIERVLIVDDNQHNRQILEYALKAWNIETVSCEDGLEAIKIVKISDPFDVIIIDYKMPVLNGIDTIKMLRADSSFNKKRQPVIIMSTSEEIPLIAEESKLSGMIHLITKPVKLRDLYNYMLNLSKSGEIPPLSDRVPYQGPSKLTESFFKESKKSDLPSPIKKTPSIASNIIEKPVIVVAEDVQMNLILMRTLIKNFIPDARIYEAYNGMEAFNITTAQRPDLIFMDVQMPVMDGLAATRQIRKEEKKRKSHTIIIALTAGASQTDKEKCLHAGMDYYLAKPINRRELQNVLCKYLKKENDSNHLDIKGIPLKKEAQKIDDPSLHFNKKEMLLRVDNDSEILLDLINSLESEMEESIAQLDSDLLNSRDKEAREVAHKVKGIALNMSFPILVEVTKKIEQAIINKELQTATLFNQIKEEWEILRKILYQ